MYDGFQMFAPCGCRENGASDFLYVCGQKNDNKAHLFLSEYGRKLWKSNEWQLLVSARLQFLVLQHSNSKTAHQQKMGLHKLNLHQVFLQGLEMGNGKRRWIKAGMHQLTALPLPYASCSRLFSFFSTGFFTQSNLNYYWHQYLLVPTVESFRGGCFQICKMLLVVQKEGIQVCGHWDGTVYIYYKNHKALTTIYKIRETGA